MITSNTFAHAVGDATLLGIVISCIVFAVAYHRKSRGAWRDNAFGRQMMFMNGALGVFVAWVWVSVTFGDFPGRDIIRVLIFGCILALVVDRIRLLFWSYKNPVDDGDVK